MSLTTIQNVVIIFPDLCRMFIACVVILSLIDSNLSINEREGRIEMFAECLPPFCGWGPVIDIFRCWGVVSPLFWV